MVDSEPALVARFLAGDDTAFEALTERYGKSVYTSCYAVLIDADRAADLTERTLAAAARELRGGAAPDLGLWLRRTAYHLAVRSDASSRPSHRPEIDPQWLAATGERGELVWDALTSLSLSHRKVLSLRVPHELDVGAIADVLGVEVVRAQRLLDDALAELRRSLAAHVVARTTRSGCAALGRLLDRAGWLGGPFPAGLYAKVDGHVGRCAVCGPARARDFVPGQWLPVVIPLLVLPEELRRRVLEAVKDSAAGVHGAGNPTSSGPGSTAGGAAAGSTAALPVAPLPIAAATPPTGGSVLSPPLATSVTTRLMSAVHTMSPVVGTDPDALRRVVALVGGLIVLATLALVASGSPEPSDPPPVAATVGPSATRDTPATTTTTTPSAIAPAPVVALTTTGRPPAPRPTTARDSGTGTATEPSPPPTSTTDRPPPADTVEVDARGLAYSSFAVLGRTAQLVAREVREIALPPGPHRLVAAGGAFVDFRVNEDRTVAYAPELAGVLEGEGTRRLTLRGVPVTVDATSVSYPTLLVHGSGEWTDTREPRTRWLLPGRNGVISAGPILTAFTVTASGEVSHDARLDPVLDVRDRSTLVLRGTPVDFDLRDNAYHGFAISGVTGPMNASRVLTLRLMPGPLAIATSSGTSYRARVDDEGAFDYDPALDPVLSGRGGRVLVAHGTCVLTWTATPASPLHAVAGTTSDDVWAVGTDSARGVVWHGNGQWRHAHTHGTGAFSELRGVSAPARDLLWAVGRTDSTTLILRGDGTGWEPVPVPGHHALFDVWASGRTSAWAVGQSPLRPLRPVALRWTGTDWAPTTVAEPAGATEVGLYEVSGTGPRDVWAVGQAVVSGRPRPLIEHWDGDRWRIVDSPAGVEANLNAVHALSPTDAWAVGQASRAGVWSAFVLRWDGVRWREAPAPEAIGALHDVVALAGREVWAVGEGGIARWNGSRWTVTAHAQSVRGVTAFGARDVVAVGHAGVSRGRC